MANKSGKKKFLIKLDLTVTLDKPENVRSDLSYYNLDNTFPPAQRRQIEALLIRNQVIQLIAFEPRFTNLILDVAAKIQCLLATDISTFFPEITTHTYRNKLSLKEICFDKILEELLLKDDVSIDKFLSFNESLSLAKKLLLLKFYSINETYMSCLSSDKNNFDLLSQISKKIVIYSSNLAIINKEIKKERFKANLFSTGTPNNFFPPHNFSTSTTLNTPNAYIHSSSASI